MRTSLKNPQGRTPAERAAAGGPRARGKTIIVVGWWWSRAVDDCHAAGSFKRVAARGGCGRRGARGSIRRVDRLPESEADRLTDAVAAIGDAAKRNERMRQLLEEHKPKPPPPKPPAPAPAPAPAFVFKPTPAPAPAPAPPPAAPAFAFKPLDTPAATPAPAPSPAPAFAFKPASEPSPAPAPAGVCLQTRSITSAGSFSTAPRQSRVQPAQARRSQPTPSAPLYYPPRKHASRV